MLKSNLKLTNRSSRDLYREFAVFVLKLQALYNCDDPRLRKLLIQGLEGDKNGFINFFSRDIETISETLMLNDVDEERWMADLKKCRKSKK